MFLSNLGSFCLLPFLLSQVFPWLPLPLPLTCSIFHSDSSFLSQGDVQTHGIFGTEMSTLARKKGVTGKDELLLPEKGDAVWLPYHTFDTVSGVALPCHSKHRFPNVILVLLVTRSCWISATRQRRAVKDRPTCCRRSGFSRLALR